LIFGVFVSVSDAGVSCGNISYVLVYVLAALLADVVFRDADMTVVDG
jgi:hypothetical protein